ncbi:MAG: Ldh family oxidoreductase, partial [Dehalococcoidia bacterium]|nr:Ldh family oxidoreductase [Dehalococcoidia bacterium]
MVKSLFEKMGVPPADASLGADVVVTADLRGVDSHGVSNMVRGYIRGLGDGMINPNPAWTIERQSPATATIDCDAGLGI